MQCVILAGGLGTRLAPLTDACPKYMVPIAGRPFAHWQLENLASQGITEAVLCIGHLGEQIRSLGDHFAGIRLSYSEEQEPLGHMDAVRNALPLLRPWFFLTYSDSYLDVNLRQMAYHFHVASEPSRLMATWNGVDFGVSIFRRSVFEHSVFPIHHAWDEIGSPEGFAKLEQSLQQKEWDI